MREYLRGETVWRKKYLYVLRPLLAMRWIESGLGPVPIEFAKLVDRTVPLGELRLAIDELVAIKRAGLELDRGPKIPAISHFVEKEMARLDKVSAEQQALASDVETLNDLFRATLLEAWGSDPTVNS